MDNAPQAESAKTLYKFTNRAESKQLDDLLAMFYMGTYVNNLGIMQAFNIETGEEEILLVGVELDEDGKADLFPLATVLSAEDTKRYLAPDGLGGFYDPRNPSEASAAKEGMKGYDDAVQPEVETVVN